MISFEIVIVAIAAVSVCSLAVLAYVIHRQWKMIAEMQNRIMSRTYSEFASFVLAGKKEKAAAAPVAAGEPAQDEDDRLDELVGKIVPDITKEIPEKMREYLGVE